MGAVVLIPETEATGIVVCVAEVTPVLLMVVAVDTLWNSVTGEQVEAVPTVLTGVL